MYTFGQLLAVLLVCTAIAAAAVALALGGLTLLRNRGRARTIHLGRGPRADRGLRAGGKMHLRHRTS
jgi:hypothetical protein